MPPKDDHFIIAIGASAGGLEAIHEFFDHMSEKTDASFVIIQHLSPDHKSLLVELVSRHTEMQVFEAEDQLEVRKNCIYVIPNNKFITIQNRKLLLTQKVPMKVPNNAIDVFLYSLAQDCKNQAIAVVLSGTGSDGTKGIEAVKEAGGLVLVQDPSTAKFDGMPNNAIGSGNVDHVLPPSWMPEEIGKFIKDLSLDRVPERSISDAQLEEIFGLIHDVVGHDFNYYKTPTILRRINRRMARSNFTKVEDYIAHLRKHADETTQLGRDFLIGVTKFFRDDDAFQFLKNDIIPAILDKKEYGDTVKIWVSACSTGEEAYSIAILLNEAMEAARLNLDIKIFASDLERSNIEIASSGTYPESVRSDIPKALLDKYFTYAGGAYTILPKVRKQIVFVAHNIIKDPPFIKNDLVSCRNMLIYMSPVLQKRVYSILLFSARRDGYLFFGSSENPIFESKGVEELSAKFKFYKKTTESKLNTYHLLDMPSRTRRRDSRSDAPEYTGENEMQTQLWDGMRKALSEDIGFAAVYIDRAYEVKEAIGNYEKLLSLPRRTLRLNILRMLPQELSLLLNNAIQKSWKEVQPVTLRNVQYAAGGENYIAQILIRPGTEVPDLCMIIIHALPSAEPREESGVSVPLESSDYVRALESELLETKNNLQLAVEDLETTNEELQSSNEELLSANEELQSSNEELQSLNEELHTLNTEHQVKIRELLELNDDLNNYFRSTDIGQVFLDRDLRIRKFNPASAKMINFIDSDLGRPITHISTNIRYDHLSADIDSVLRTSQVVEKEVQLVNGKNLLMRILPYITRDRKNEGIIISFVDITTVTNLNNIIRGVFNSSYSAIFAFHALRDHTGIIYDFTILTANEASRVFLPKGQEISFNRSLKKEMPLLVINGMFEKYVSVVQEDLKLHTHVYFEHDGTWYEVSAVKMMDGLVATFTDVTEKKSAEQRLKKNYVELVAVKDNLKKLNAELESKVVERTRELTASEERFRLVARATNDALWDWDFINNNVWWGDAFYKNFGYEPGENVSRNFWFEKIHPDDRLGVQENIYDVINNHQSQWTKEYRFLKANGEYADILDRGYILHDEYGTPYRMLGSMLDLTDLKRAQQALSSNIAQRKFMAESMPLIVLTAQEDGNVDFVNAQFELYTGMNQKDALKQGWQGAVHADDLKGLEASWRNAVSRKGDFQREIRLLTAGGDYRWNILRAAARRDMDGRLVSWVFTTIDIHEQKVQNEVLELKVSARTQELQRINQALEASNHDLQQFASVASHDLQEPLRKIHMFAKLIKDKSDDINLDGSAVFLEKIIKSADRMRSLVTNVLNFSKLSSDNNRFEETPVDRIIADILDDFEIIIEEKRARVIVENPFAMDVIPGQIRQVFQNLISNALKFSKPGVDPLITISAQRVAELSLDSVADEQGGFYKIVVQDNGIGFDEQFREEIFKLFHRLNSKDRFEGTGIGLALVKKIVEKHQGIIVAHGNPGEGATFELVMPVKHVSDNYLVAEVI